MWLNVAFHPTQADFDTFFPRLLKIRDSGFHIPIVNFVLAPENLVQFDTVYKALEKENFSVNISTSISTGIYISRTERTERELDIVEKYNTPLDNHFKIIKPTTKGSLLYPEMTYYLMYDGAIRVACQDGTARNLFTDGPPPIPREAVPCEYQQCIGCADMYRALVDEPLLTEPLKLHTLEDYADEVRAWRQEQQRQEKLRKLPLGLGRLFGAASNQQRFRDGIPQPQEPGPQQLLPISAITQPLPDSPVFGQTDHRFIEARSRDRISISGRAASRKQETPVREVRILVAEKEIGVIRSSSTGLRLPPRLARRT